MQLFSSMFQPNKSKHRRGGVAVEMAICFPVILLFFSALWEWSRVEMIRHVADTAVFQAVRHGTLPGATEAEMETVAEDVLSMYFVSAATVTADIDMNLRQAYVQVVVPIDANTWVSSNFFQGRQVSTELTLPLQK